MSSPTLCCCHLNSTCVRPCSQASGHTSCGRTTVNAAPPSEHCCLVPTCSFSSLPPPSQQRSMSDDDAPSSSLLWAESEPHPALWYDQRDAINWSHRFGTVWSCLCWPRGRCPAFSCPATPWSARLPHHTAEGNTRLTIRPAPTYNPYRQDNQTNTTSQIMGDWDLRIVCMGAGKS